MGGIAGQVIFTAGWLAGAQVQDSAYSSARHDLVAGFVAYAALGGQSVQGLAQRAITVVACGRIAALAVHVLRLRVPRRGLVGASR